MMTLPSSSQLISVVRAEISSTLGGLSDDPAIVNCLAMIDTLLASIAVRCEHEISWMAAEIEDIHEVAQRLLGAGHDDGRVATGLAILNRHHPTTLDAEAVRARYHAASAVFADCVELAPASDAPLQQKITEAIDHRLDHEREIRGDLSLVGRG